MKPVILIVLDGFGLAPAGPGNAIYLANPVNINSLLHVYPNTTLKASGEAVGLPNGEVGNTEVGHINLGAGRVVYQDLPRINMSIADGSFYQNKALLEASSHVKKTNGVLHLIGLIGQGTVHSSVEHLNALLHFTKEQKIGKVYIHAITDGRDSPPKGAEQTISQLEEKLKQIGIGTIATVMGRYYAMDRDRRWDRIEKAYVCLTKGEGEKASSAVEAIKASYKNNVTDEFILPTNIVFNGQPVLIKENDAVIFFNFRIDRPRELTKAFVLEEFEADANKSFSFDPYAVKYHKTHFPDQKMVSEPFKRGPKIKNLCFVTLTEYEKNLGVNEAFPPIVVTTTLGKVLSDIGLYQLRMAETEKERFVTYYFNGQRELPFPYEDRLIIPSPHVPTYDQKPEMAAYDLTNVLIKKMQEKRFAFILINFANSDMVGHTGSIEATIKAIKVIDECVGRITNMALNLDYTIFLTADHGNAEQKINPQTGEISTEHTANPVPFIAINKEFQGKYAKLQTGILGDVAPTILTYMEVQKPIEMTGRDLLEEIKH